MLSKNGPCVKALDTCRKLRARDIDSDRDGRTPETLAELTSPGVDDGGVVLENASLTLCRTRNMDGEVVLPIGPVHDDQGGEHGAEGPTIKDERASNAMKPVTTVQEALKLVDNHKGTASDFTSYR
jgi:hypothetical protein